mmetsp:Transcript_9026/g.22290  ORF Transcript_9026/g.22290 Transcript_9026/m.22290 type:complete len:233 (+) Transcript_9026:1142-1840(+)
MPFFEFLDHLHDARAMLLHALDPHPRVVPHILDPRMTQRADDGLTLSVQPEHFEPPGLLPPRRCLQVPFREPLLQRLLPPLARPNLLIVHLAEHVFHRRARARARPLPRLPADDANQLGLVRLPVAVGALFLLRIQSLRRLHRRASHAARTRTRSAARPGRKVEELVRSIHIFVLLIPSPAAFPVRSVHHSERVRGEKLSVYIDHELLHAHLSHVLELQKLQDAAGLPRVHL